MTQEEIALREQLKQVVIDRADKPCGSSKGTIFLNDHELAILLALLAKLERYEKALQDILDGDYGIEVSAYSSRAHLSEMNAIDRIARAALEPT